MLTGCENTKLNLEGVTKIEVYDWQNNELIKTIEDSAFIEVLVAKLNQATGEIMSDTADTTIFKR